MIVMMIVVLMVIIIRMMMMMMMMMMILLMMIMMMMILLMIMMMMISFVGIDYQENWARSALLGLSASTGQLSDNHDVISLKSFTDVKVRHRDDDW